MLTSMQMMKLDLCIIKNSDKGLLSVFLIYVTY